MKIVWEQDAEDKTRVFLRQQEDGRLGIFAGDNELSRFIRGMVSIRLRCHDIVLPKGRLRELAQEELQKKRHS